MIRNPGTTYRLELLGIRGRAAHLLIWLIYVTMSVLALLALDDVYSPTLVYISIALFGAISWLLVRDSNPRVSFGVCLFVTVASVCVALLSSWNSINGGFSQWYVGAGAFAMFYLSLRGRDVCAWIGFSAIGLVVVGWGLTTDDRLLEAILLVARQVPIILVGTLFVFGMKLTSRRLESVQATITARAAAEAAALARTAERSRRLAELDSVVGPQLRRIAHGDELSDDDRRELLIAEARLRDGMRARQLNLPEVVAAVARARRRGVAVLLLDDRYPMPVPSESLNGVTAAAVQLLDAAIGGTVTIRLLPAGRALLATMVSDGDRYARVELPAPHSAIAASLS